MSRSWEPARGAGWPGASRYRKGQGLGLQPRLGGEALAALEHLRAMTWRPIPPREYILGLLGGLALGAAVASAAIWAAILTA